MDKIATGRFVDPIDDCMFINDHLDVIQSHLETEDFWDFLMSLFRLGEFFEEIDEETRQKIAGSPEFIARVNNCMRDWTEVTSPRDGWPRHLLARLEPAASLTPTLIERIKADKLGVIRSLKEIEDRAGPDWGNVAADPEQLKAYADMLAITEMRERGIVPDHYTATTECQHCESVPIFEGVPAMVEGCPWCFNRIKALPIPSARHDIDEMRSGSEQQWCTHLPR